jgi:DnaJ-class molecular chaperone
MGYHAIAHWPKERLVFGETIPCNRCKGKGQVFIRRAGTYTICYLCHGLGYYKPDISKGRT